MILPTQRKEAYVHHLPVVFARLTLATVVLSLSACGAPTPVAPAAPTTAPAAATKAPPAAAPTTAPAVKAPEPTAAPAASAALPADAAPQQTLRMVIGGFGSQEPLAPWSVRWGGQDVGAYEFLSPVYHDVDFNVRPLLARSITPNADFTVWTVNLDPRAVWSDGTKVTAKQVKEAWEWVTLPDQKTSNISGFALSDAKGTMRSVLSDGEIASFSEDGKINWSPEWERLSPEEKQKVQALSPKMPTGKP